MNANKISVADLKFNNFTQADIDDFIANGFKPYTAPAKPTDPTTLTNPPTTKTYVRADGSVLTLPSDWSKYTVPQQIVWLNANKISEADLKLNNFTSTDIKGLKDLGFVPYTAPPELPIIKRPADEITETKKTAFQPFYKSPTILQPTRGMTALLSTPNVTPEQDFRGYNPQTLIDTAQEFIYQNPKLEPTALPSFLKDEFKLTPQEVNYIVQNVNYGARPADIVPPSLTYATTGFTAPSQGGLTNALNNKTVFPGGAPDYYKAINNYLISPNADLSPTGVAQAMRQTGVTTDDLIKAKAIADASFINPPVTSPVTPPPDSGGGARGRAGGLIKRYEKGGEINTEIIETVPDYVIENLLSKKPPFNTETIKTVPDYAIKNSLLEKPLFKEKKIDLSEPSLKEAMKKYTLEDFGIIQPKTNVFSYETGKMYTPLKEMEAIAYANMSPAEKEYYLQQMMVRQGRTGAEYFPASMFKKTAPATNLERAMYQYAEGGGVGRGLSSIAMKGYAEELRRQGRDGDTMLAHINPQEAKMLEMMGGSGTINPATGLPEYGFSWKKLLKAAQFIIPFIPGLGPIASAALSGIAGGFAGPGKGFDFKRGLLSGLASYGLGQIGKGLEAAGGPGVGAPIIDKSELMFGPPAPASSFSNPSMLTDFRPAAETIMAPPVSNATAPIDVASGPVTQGMSPGPSLGARVLDSGQNMYQGVSNIISGTPGSSEAFKATAGFSPATAIAGTVAGLGTLSGYDESKVLQLQQAALAAKTQEERDYYEDLARRLLRGFAGGGNIMALVGGGATGPANSPRTVNGAGDGMSDSVPANIEGIQEARLADGEFVIPADVVADLGNGSSNAGSKKLYAMMDRIRQARHGTAKQPPEVNMGRLMPA